MRVLRHRYAVVAVFALAVLVEGAVFFGSYAPPVGRFPNGDARDYVPRAQHLWEHGDLSVTPSTFRPPGYSVVLAALCGFGSDDEQVTRSAVVLNYLLDRIVLIGLLAWIAGLFRRYVAWTLFFVLLLQPWTNASGIRLTPDSIALLLATLGIGLLGRSASRERSARGLAPTLLAGSAALSAAAVFRSEMIAYVPLLVATCFLLLRLTSRQWLLLGSIAALPVLAAWGLNVAYWHHLDGRLALLKTPEQRHPGLIRWQTTWPGSERLKLQMQWSWARGGDALLWELPDAAFDNEQERARVMGLFERTRGRRDLAQAEDAEFGRIAEERIRRRPWRVARIKASEAVHFWTSPEGLRSGFLAGCIPERTPGWVYRVLDGIVRGLKPAVLVGALAGAVLLLLGRATVRPGLRMLLWLGVVFVLGRWLSMVLIVPWIEARYLVPTWPFVLLLFAFCLDRVRGTGGGS